MDKKALVEFVINKNENVYRFSAPMYAPLGETHDVLYEIIKEVVAMAQERSEKAEKKSDAEEQIAQ